MAILPKVKYSVFIIAYFSSCFSLYFISQTGTWLGKNEKCVHISSYKTGY